MAFCIGSSGCCSSSSSTHLLSIRSDANSKAPRIVYSLPLGRRASESHVARARRISSRSKKSNLTTSPQKEEQLKAPPFPEDATASVDVDDGFVMPDLPGQKPDFWEGPQWNAFGFFAQYLWAFGVVFALIACGIAVATYNEGATDFKETPAYKESTQTRESLDAPEASGSDVFEGNPTEEAPSLE